MLAPVIELKVDVLISWQTFLFLCVFLSSSFFPPVYNTLPFSLLFLLLKNFLFSSLSVSLAKSLDKLLTRVKNDKQVTFPLFCSIFVCLRIIVCQFELKALKLKYREE